MAKMIEFSKLKEGDPVLLVSKDQQNPKRSDFIWKVVHVSSDRVYLQLLDALGVNVPNNQTLSTAYESDHEFEDATSLLTKLNVIQAEARKAIESVQ